MATVQLCQSSLCAEGTSVGYLLWIPAAALLGFALAALFSGVLRLPRNIYLIPYMGGVGLFLYAFVHWSRLPVTELVCRNWIWGTAGGVLLGVWTVRNIMSQPSSPRREGFGLLVDLVWTGALYGLVDALLLSVLPVFATFQAFSILGWTAHWWGRVFSGILAIVFSLVVTVAYHLGYPECRRRRGLFGPTLGNGVMTLGYVVTGSPLAALLSHMAMHIAGVLRGPASVMQLPPH